MDAEAAPKPKPRGRPSPAKRGQNEGTLCPPLAPFRRLRLCSQPIEPSLWRAFGLGDRGDNGEAAPFVSAGPCAWGAAYSLTGQSLR